MTIRTITSAIAFSSLLVACGDDPKGNNTNGTPNNSSNNVTNNVATNNQTTNNVATNNQSTNNMTVAPLTGAALAVSADFGTASSAWHAVTLAEEPVADRVDFGGGDLAASLGDRWAYVLDRNSSQVQVLDPAAGLAGLGVIDVSGIEATNPQFAADAGGKAFVTLYNSGEIVIATPDGMNWDVTRLDLAEYDDFDQNPEPSAIIADGDHVLVVLQRLQNFVGVDNSLLLVLDADGVVLSELDLGGRNAQAGLRRVGTAYAVGITGDFGVNDGGILRIGQNGPDAFTPSDMLVDEAVLGGDLLDFVMVDAQLGFAVISLPDFSSQLVKFTVGGATEVVGAVSAPGFGGLDVSADARWLAVGDRADGDPHIALFDLMDSSFGTHFDVSMPLPPSGFRFLAP